MDLTWDVANWLFYHNALRDQNQNDQNQMACKGSIRLSDENTALVGNGLAVGRVLQAVRGSGEPVLASLLSLLQSTEAPSAKLCE